MSDRQLRDEVMTLVLAGHETTALALTWTWCLLAEHPQVEARLHAELDSQLQGRAPQVADVARLPFTHAVIAEVLRLYPPVWATGREAIEDTRIGDMAVWRGTVVLLSPWATHRDARFCAHGGRTSARDHCSALDASRRTCSLTAPGSLITT